MKNLQSVSIEYLLEHLPASHTAFDRENIRRAYEVAEKAHAEQKRASGEPYITHCVAVANILAEMRMQPEVVIAGLLHDTVEDTPLTLEDLSNQFGEEVAKLVKGVTKLDSLPRVSRADRLTQQDAVDDENLSPEEINEKVKKQKHQLAKETIRKTILAMGDDVRIVLIKLADRLHNMRTLGYTRPDKQRRIAQETLDIYAQLANRLGIWQVKWELEDLAFRYVNPEKYKEIAEQISERRSTREEQISQIVQKVQTVLSDVGIQAEVKGRPKHIYSIYKKMEKKGKTFDEVKDIRGVRLIVPDIPACYAALGIIHNHWRPIPSEFDDYIAAPKDNFYQSLHTAVLYEDGKPLEVQIRTPEMDQNSEYGIAAHWRYKEGSARDAKYEQHIAALRKMMEWKEDVKDTEEFLDSMQSDVFEDRVYAFTPKGDTIDLPSGSTPIDFAYHVHTDIGHRCRGAKVNGKLVPLDYVLKTGQTVVILTSKQGGPSRDWLNTNLGLVKTQRARAKIRAWFKKQDRGQNLLQGRQILERELRRLGLGEINQEMLARRLEFRNTDDFFVALGCGELNINYIINQIDEQTTNTPDNIQTSAPSPADSSGHGIAINGVSNLAMQLARCCNPTPGDPIIGYITRGRGVSVHRQDCSNILRAYTNEKERLMAISWGEQDSRYPVQIVIYAIDRTGLMGDISNLISNESANITDVSVSVSKKRASADIAELRLTLEVRNLEHLARILGRMANLPNVLEVRRLRGG
ncbi:MAG: bifunctional (p)ppGpp synthetase/guanosine-3',5'-bis(diphosphate) 3'-pyrophosphohydrolase [Anaerolineales bacterium]